MYDVNTTVSDGVSGFDGTATNFSQKIRGEIDKKDKSRHYKIEFYSGEIVDFIEGFRGGADLTVELGKPGTGIEAGDDKATRTAARQSARYGWSYRFTNYWINNHERC